MRRLEEIFIQKLDAALKKTSPQSVPRTGDRAKGIDCYSVYVSDKKGTYLASEVLGSKLKVHLWDEDKQKHTIPKTLYLDKLNDLNFEVTHYHGVVTHTYTSWLTFTLAEATAIYRVLSPLVIAWSKVYVFFKFYLPRLFAGLKSIDEPNKEQVLSEIVSINRISRHQDFEASKLLQSRYGIKVVMHPDYPRLLNEWSLILESMVEEGEIAGVASRFRIKGKALTSLQSIRDEKARQKRSDRNARWMTILTLILAFTALFQSDLVDTGVQINLDELVEWGVSKANEVMEWIKSKDVTVAL